MKDYALNLFSSLLQGKAPFGNIADFARGWWNSTRGDGGYWLGGFQVSNEDIDLNELTRWFYNYLGYHIEESVYGEISWEGQIFEIDLVINGHRKRRTLENYDPEKAVSNWMKANYLDENNAPQVYGPWAQVQSVDRYGQIQEILRMDGYDLSAVQARLGTELQRRAWPFAQTLSLSQADSNGDRIEIRCWGYVHTANYRYVTSADGGKDNVSIWIQNIVNTDCEFLSPGKIKTNTLQVKRTLPTPMRTWDKLSQLGGLGDSAYKPWRTWVSRGRLLNYEPMDPTPIYYWHNGQVLDLNRHPVHPRLVRPGVIRDLNYPQSRTEPDAFLQDARDTWLGEITVDERGMLNFANSDFPEAQFLAAQGEFFKAQE